MIADARYFDEKYLDKLIREEELKKKCDDEIRTTFFDVIMEKFSSEENFKLFMEEHFSKELLEIAQRTYGNGRS